MTYSIATVRDWLLGDMDHWFVSAGYFLWAYYLQQQQYLWEREEKEIGIGGEKYSREKTWKMWVHKGKREVLLK